MIKIFEAFAGYGTATFALKQLGIDYELVGFSEINKYAVQCFEQNHLYWDKSYLSPKTGNLIKKPKNFGDISKINWYFVPDFDLLTGGFPCQDVSVAGHQDLSKGRSILGFELAKALKIKQPKYFLFENVKGILSKKFKPFLKELLEKWSEAGYNVVYKKLNTKEHGIPQNRERVFFVGFRKDLAKELYDFEFPEKEELKIFVKDILEESVDDKYLLSEKQVNRILESDDLKKKFSYLNPEVAGTLTARQYASWRGNFITTNKIDRIQFDVSGKGYKSIQDRVYGANGVMACLPNAHPDNKVNIFALRGRNPENPSDRTTGMGTEQRPEFKDDGTSNTISTVQKDNYVSIYQLGRGYNRGGLKDGKISPTISQNGWEWNNFILDNFIFRRLTPKECFRLQGFLNDEVNLEGISDSQAYKLAGNGQSVNVVARLFKEMFL